MVKRNWPVVLDEDLPVLKEKLETDCRDLMEQIKAQVRKEAEGLVLWDGEEAEVF
jgi:hypothetical protein